MWQCELSLGCLGSAKVRARAQLGSVRCACRDLWPGPRPGHWGKPFGQPWGNHQTKGKPIPRAVICTYFRFVCFVGHFLQDAKPGCSMTFRAVHIAEVLPETKDRNKSGHAQSNLAGPCKPAGGSIFAHTVWSTYGAHTERTRRRYKIRKILVRHIWSANAYSTADRSTCTCQQRLHLSQRLSLSLSSWRIWPANRRSVERKKEKEKRKNPKNPKKDSKID